MSTRLAWLHRWILIKKMECREELEMLQIKGMISFLRKFIEKQKKARGEQQ